MGDVATAGAFLAPNPLAIMNTGSAFVTKEIESSYRGSPEDTLEIYPNRLSDSDIANALR